MKELVQRQRNVAKIRANKDYMPKVSMRNGANEVIPPGTFTEHGIHAKNYQIANSSMEVPHYQTSTEFINNLDMPVYVINQDGTKILLEPRTGDWGDRKKVFLAEVKHRWNYKYVSFNSKGLSSDKTGYMTSYDLDKTLDTSTFSEMIFNVYDDLKSKLTTRPHNNTCKGTVVYSVSSESFEMNNYNIYLRDLNIVIVAKDVYNSNVAHPLSEVYRVRDVDSSQNDETLLFKMFINVHPNTAYGERYVNILNQVYSVPRISDPAVREGVYQLVHRPSVTTVYPDETVLTDNYLRASLEDGDEAFNMYRNIHDAADHFNILSEKQRLDRLEEDERLRLQKLEDDELKRLSDLAHDESRRQIEKLKMENRRLTEEAAIKSTVRKDTYEELSLNRKDVYESRSTSRKTWLESIGWLPKIIAGALGIIGIGFAFFL